MPGIQKFMHTIPVQKICHAAGGDNINVIHVSTHVSLRQACDLVKKEKNYTGDWINCWRTEKFGQNKFKSNRCGWFKPACRRQWFYSAPKTDGRFAYCCRSKKWGMMWKGRYHRIPFSQKLHKGIWWSGGHVPRPGRAFQTGGVLNEMQKNKDGQCEGVTLHWDCPS